ncbi:hypothetical protein CFOL_v3_34140 [Cephalotus follicularis]|uniref:UGP3-like C-terminal hexapeptide repeats domain-containing protein n=1 Tax=Cephalotus follicularis TaxID=3775 RepID=A0A1Q3DDY3_CEPFO|nr:hypothetical protein CFOL_v3_34140 [Cephalotus follicularis]
MANTTSTTLLHYNRSSFFTFTSKTTPLHSLHSNTSLIFKIPLYSFSFASSPCCRITTTTSVTIAPVEYTPPAPDFNFHQEISRLKTLRTMLSNSNNLKEKHSVINCDFRVKQFFFNSSKANDNVRVLDSLNLDLNESFLIKCLVAAGQEHVLSFGFEMASETTVTVRSSLKTALYALAKIIEECDVNKSGVGGVVLHNEEIGDFKRLLKILGEIEQFYDCIGGIIGYQIKVLELLDESTFERQTTADTSRFVDVQAPSGIDLLQNTEYASQAALWGIEGLPELGEIYPLGGSADRLGLVDPDTGECLPAAMLPYCGRTFLEGLIRDLQAREFLYFKLYGKQCITPVAIMTSSAKNNHDRISSLCKGLGWFGRGQSSFQLFEQPIVPAVSAKHGQWWVMKPFAPVCKPGGHGVIWKLAYDKGVFRWFFDQGRKGATVRQVSNVVAATDLTILALAGIGLRHGKKLGFASCKRNSGATDGINVLIEKKNLDGKWAYGLSCIEYTEFDKFGMTSGPISSNSLLAEFPANTNILYVDLPSVELVASRNDEKSLPGMVLNLKKPIVYVDQFGDCHSVSGGRLECTMQNIADNFSNTYSSRCCKGVEEKLDTFLVYNERRRVTSSAKRKRKHTEKSLHQQTPDGSLLDILRNAYDLLSQCNIHLPEIESNDRYVDCGPPYLILLHPALGPIWEVIRQKFNVGSISKGSELQIEVSEFMWKNVQLDGSLVIVADNVMGSIMLDNKGEPILQYGHRCGRCKLHNVKVRNEGIDWSCGDNIYWKHDVKRFEVFKIILHGNAEFEAKDVVLEGNRTFEVPHGYKMKITSGHSDLAIQLDPIGHNIADRGSWHWNYKIEGSHIRLELLEL